MALNEKTDVKPSHGVKLFQVLNISAVSCTKIFVMGGSVLHLLALIPSTTNCMFLLIWNCTWLKE